jgi:cation transport ATPase
VSSGVCVDKRPTFRLRDAPRAEGRSFIQHLGPKHQFQHVMIVSGDRESEVRYLGEQVGISEADISFGLQRTLL